jgi:hypothetical protein
MWPKIVAELGCGFCYVGVCLIWTPAPVAVWIGTAAGLVGSARYRQISGPRRIAACEAFARTASPPRTLRSFSRSTEAITATSTMLQLDLSTATGSGRPDCACAALCGVRKSAQLISASAIDRPRGPSIFKEPLAVSQKEGYPIGNHDDVKNQKKQFGTGANRGNGEAADESSQLSLRPPVQIPSCLWRHPQLGSSRCSTRPVCLLRRISLVVPSGIRSSLRST